MISTQFSNGYGSRSYSINNLQQASILVWHNKNKESAIMPILSIKPKLQQSYYKQQQLTQQGDQNDLKCTKNSINNSQYKQNQQIYFQWSQIAKLILQQGPLSDFQLLISNYQNLNQKFKFRVNINEKEKLIISARGNQNVGEICDKIQASFFSTCVIQEQEYKGTLKVDDLPTYIKKVKINNRNVQMKENITRVASENDIIYVTISKKNIVDTDAQKKLLRKYEEYNQRKAKEIKQQIQEKCQINEFYVKNSQNQNKLKNNNNNINMTSDDSSSLESHYFGKKKVQQNTKDQQRTIKVICKILLCLNTIQVDIWDPIEEENIQLQLSQEESVEDLKWLLENYLDFEADRTQLICSVYASQQIFEFEKTNIFYELFSDSSSLVFYNRLKGG